jgi:His-Xaa-Ser system protein HxsD
MTSPVEGLPADCVEADVQNNTVTLGVDAAVYPLDAVYAASYVFIDRCYVLIDQPKAGHFRVTLAPKKGSDASALRACVGEFANELLSSAWRQKITHENRALIEAVTTQALAGAMGPPSLDDLASFDFTADTFEDPLGIAMSWEEKYKKNKPGAEAPPSAPATDGSTGGTGTTGGGGTP